MWTAPPTLSVVARGGGTVCLILGPVISGLWPKCRVVGVEALGVTLATGFTFCGFRGVRVIQAAIFELGGVTPEAPYVICVLPGYGVVSNLTQYLL